MSTRTSTLSNPEIRFNNGIQVGFANGEPVWAQPIGQEPMRAMPNTKRFETYMERYQAPPKYRQTNGRPAQACQNRIVVSFDETGQPIQAEHLDDPQIRCTPEDAVRFTTLVMSFYAHQSLSSGMGLF